MRQVASSGGLAAWSIHHPVGVTMAALAVVVLGLFALGRLSIDLLPHLIYPEVRVRILNPGMPATVVEDQITRQLEEQLAITEDAISVQSRSSEGAARVDLSFEYGKDIDIALRDASTRLDRAKRFLPTSIDPPVIYKRDPSQIPVAEYVVSSPLMDPVELRDFVDEVFDKWFLNLPGVAAVEVGGGLAREIHILVDQNRLLGLGLSMQTVIDTLQRSNLEDPMGRLEMSTREFSGRVSNRYTSVDAMADQPIALPGGGFIRLREIAQVVDTHEDDRMRVRLNNIPGIKMSIQKQPLANTVSVVEAVQQRMQYLQEKNLIPEDIQVHTVADQSIYIRQALNNSSLAAFSGALLAMAVVYIFLGNLRHTLIIGSAIPIAIMVTFVLMALGGLTLNIMTLGGLALGVGMLVDNTIVMLENIYRHQREGEDVETAGVTAAGEVNSAIVASTSTNLAAVLPFLFVGGLIGLLFRELIITISAAIVASMIIALTLVPALAAQVRVTGDSGLRTYIDGKMLQLRSRYRVLAGWILERPWLPVGVLVVALGASAPVFFPDKQIFLPKMDDGQVTVIVRMDPGVTVDTMDRTVERLERLFQAQKDVASVFSLVGVRIFGRTERLTPNRSTLTVQLVPLAKRRISSEDWIKRMQKLIDDEQLTGVHMRMYTRGIRGIRTSRGDDDISLRIQGLELDTLEALADDIVARLKNIDGLRNLQHSSEETFQELSIEIDQERAATLDLTADTVANALQIALEGKVISQYLEGDRGYDVRIRLPRQSMRNPQDLESVLLFPPDDTRPAIYLGNVAHIRLTESPATIMRDNQQRIVEISASIKKDAAPGAIMKQIDAKLAEVKLPPGYSIYDGGLKATLQEGRQTAWVLIALAVFLVFVVMAIQYESLRNPVIIILSVPFATIGVALGVMLVGLSISMPIWLGMIMLAGIVVNNSIVLVEYIEILRRRGNALRQAILQAAELRLRPILMTTLTTVIGMSPLALGLGEGAEMLQPLAVAIVAGLSFSMLVTLGLIPSLYFLFYSRLLPVDSIAAEPSLPSADTL